MQKGVFTEMLNIYKPIDIDWMGYKISKKNPLTYHHIKEVSKKGKKKVDNGALLTKKAHNLLHEIQKYNLKLYNEWQQLFREINETHSIIDDMNLEKIKKLRLKTEKTIDLII